MIASLTWTKVKAAAKALLQRQHLSELYRHRLNFELSEIEKQGAEGYWLDRVANKIKCTANPNHLLLPWLFQLVENDPIAGHESEIICSSRSTVIADYLQRNHKLPLGVYLDTDKPDIDIDCLPDARDEIKDYAAKKYGAQVADDYGVVCSVATWMGYLLRSAILSVAQATKYCDAALAQEVTKELPPEVDELRDAGFAPCKGKVLDAATSLERECGVKHDGTACPTCGSTDTEWPTIGQLLQEHEALASFNRNHPEVVSLAVRLVGRMHALGKHAGALVIADRPLYGNLPLAFDSDTKQWKCLWPEGRSPQLSKFGYTKWDILGLKNLQYIDECCKMIERNHGISFGKNLSGWDQVNPFENRAGYYWDRNGQRTQIDLDDPKALALASDMRTDAVFQFDTDLAKSIIGNGVRNFRDLMVFAAMGHPGPMQSIPTYVERRDDPKHGWQAEEHPKVAELLQETMGVLVYQEDLQRVWQELAGFTATEAQEARKAVAKKWREKLKPIQQHWLEGASKTMSAEEAKHYWSLMETFGRYAFNKSHGLAYCLVAYRCLWLKAYFPHEWWAAVTSYCDSKKHARYINVARAEGVKFDTLDVLNLGTTSTAVPDRPRTRHTDPPNGRVVPGLTGIKQVGEKMAEPLTKLNGTKFENIDDFVEIWGKSKVIFERLIKLGAFSRLPGHGNARALWHWYQYKYCNGTEITQFRQAVKEALLTNAGWNEQTVEAERVRQREQYRALYPNRKAVPKKIDLWRPLPQDTRENVMALYEDDFSLKEILEFERDFLGYLIHSPLGLYRVKGGSTINEAKEKGRLEAVVTGVGRGLTRRDSIYYKLTVTDGLQSTIVFVWESEYNRHDRSIFRIGNGLSMAVDYDKQRNSFSLMRGTLALCLNKKDTHAA